MNRSIFEKLKSRKLWMALVGVVIGVAMAFGVEGTEIERIFAMISGAVTALGSINAFINGEAKVDAAASVPINMTFGESKPAEKPADGEEAVNE